MIKNHCIWNPAIYDFQLLLLSVSIYNIIAIKVIYVTIIDISNSWINYCKKNVFENLTVYIIIIIYLKSINYKQRRTI